MYIRKCRLKMDGMLEHTNSSNTVDMVSLLQG